ncbi:MAG: chromate efflux transporter [Deltaproteobacteria bacterium]|nr:chromate efflux transporter [Deltaproteobacteria bacterium]
MQPSLTELFLSFLRLGAVSFGGPAMVAYIKTLAVKRKGWVSEDEFKGGVALCQAIPGATAMQCAAYVGWKARGFRGAAATYVGFGLPAFALMLALSIAYQRAAGMPAVAGVLAGLRAIVVALIAHAAWSFGRSTIKSSADAAVAVATASAFLLGANPMLTVAGAALAGTLLLRGAVDDGKRGSRPLAGWKTTIAPLSMVLFGACFVVAAFAVEPKLGRLGLVMLKTDAMAFGGGFSAIPVMFHEVVDVRGWLPSQTFLDGIALGQVTPGPIVITSTFVGFQTAGYLGAVVSTVCMLLPSFLVLVLAEPWFDRLQGSALFRAGVRGALVSFVGLLVSTTLQFAKAVPWNVLTVVIAVASLVALLRKVNVVWVVGAGVVISAVSTRL